MTTARTLEAAGYRKFVDGSVRMKGEHCVALWQRRVEDAEGIRYFLNVFEWDMKKAIPDYPGRSPAFEAEVQFRLEGDAVVNVTLPSGQMNLAEAELFFSRMWHAMDFIHVEKHAWVRDEAAGALP